MISFLYAKKSGKHVVKLVVSRQKYDEYRSKKLRSVI